MNECHLEQFYLFLKIMCLWECSMYTWMWVLRSPEVTDLPGLTLQVVLTHLNGEDWTGILLWKKTMPFYCWAVSPVLWSSSMFKKKWTGTQRVPTHLSSPHKDVCCTIAHLLQLMSTIVQSSQAVRIPSGLCSLWTLTNTVVGVYTEQSLTVFNLSEHSVSKVAFQWHTQEVCGRSSWFPCYQEVESFSCRAYLLFCLITSEWKRVCVQKVTGRASEGAAQSWADSLCLLMCLVPQGGLPWCWFKSLHALEVFFSLHFLN